MSRPNILILQADQMAAQALSLYGGFTETPHLAGLAADGTVFENFYCNYPLCAPSRFSMLTGQLASTIGAWDNAAELPAAVPTFAHYLRQAGYHTCLSGKMHFIGPDQFHGFEDRLTTEIYPADFAWLPDWETRAQGWAPNRDTIERGGVTVHNMQLAYDEEATFYAERQIYEYARATDRPFCLVVSLTHPHFPFLVPPRYWDLYRDDEIPMPRIGRLPDAELDPHSRRVRRVLGLEDSDVTPDQTRDARHAYFGAIRYFDDKVGRLLRALKEARLDDETAVIVTSDHGEMLGERGLWCKDLFFEWAMRVPFITRIPGLPGGNRVGELASLVDLLPTLLDLAGIDEATLAEPVEGTSLLDSMRAGTRTGRHRVAAEYSAEGADAPMIMIRRDGFKYIHAEGDPPQLFDLESDPDELVNLADRPEQAERCETFRAEVERDWDLSSMDREIRLSQRRRALVAAALDEGRHESWDHQPRPDHSRLYVRGRTGSEAVDRKIRLPAEGYPFRQ